uniref:SOSS complex subunit B1 n=1 Tax=Anthurium amnicola TaxID=1678845 RepID=A0A1D1ZEW6_9ARAE
MMLLKDIVPSAANSVNTKFIVLEKGNIRVSKKSTIVDGRNKIQETRECLTLVADESACVYFLLWNTECEAFESGDILRLTNGIFSYHWNKLVLRSGRKGKVEKAGEFTMLFVEKPNMSEIQQQASENDPKKLVQESATSTDLQSSHP